MVTCRSLALLTVVLSQAVLASNSPNVCSTLILKRVSRRHRVIERYKQIYYSSCFDVSKFFKCTKIRIMTRHNYQTVWDNVQHVQFKCCAGYKNGSSINTCVPECQQKCVNGWCEAPGQCRCREGYHGANCADRCPGDTWGHGCKNACRCSKEHSEYCNPIDGSCVCKPGYAGQRCESECPGGKFGERCRDTCQCLNDAKCDNVIGKCECKPGFSGPTCATKCLGRQCDSNCWCLNGGKCVDGSQECKCAPGYYGEVCGEPCHGNYFGENCRSICQCRNNATCDRVTGACSCPGGFKGVRCSEYCSDGEYGPGCGSTCRCLHGKCDKVDGTCECDNSYGGVLCNQRKCPDGYFGDRCESTCRCSPIGTKECHSGTGECNCQLGYTGLRCLSRCQLGYYGADCVNVCECHLGASCHPESGECKCLPGSHGVRCGRVCGMGLFGPACAGKCNCFEHALCDKKDGQCECKHGAKECRLSCPEGFYGAKCANNCTCPLEPPEHCHDVDGGCECSRGWRRGRTGHCDVSCEPDKWGYAGCSFDCQCQNAEKRMTHGRKAYCSLHSGNCFCRPGWTGYFCGTPCRSDYWGKDCQNRCECLKEFVCDPVTGACICNSASCDAGAAPWVAAQMDATAGTSPLVFLAVALAVAFVAVVAMVLLVCYKCPRPKIPGRTVAFDNMADSASSAQTLHIPYPVQVSQLEDSVSAMENPLYDARLHTDQSQQLENGEFPSADPNAGAPNDACPNTRQFLNKTYNEYSVIHSSDEDSDDDVDVIKRTSSNVIKRLKSANDRCGATVDLPYRECSRTDKGARSDVPRYVTPGAGWGNASFGPEPNLDDPDYASIDDNLYANDVETPQADQYVLPDYDAGGRPAATPSSATYANMARETWDSCSPATDVVEHPTMATSVPAASQEDESANLFTVD